MDISEIISHYQNIEIKLPPAPISFINITEVSKDVDHFDEKVHLQAACSQPFEATGVFKYAIEKYRIIAQGDDIKSVYDLTLNTKSSIDYMFNPGDTVGVLTRNSEEDVADLLRHLDLESASDQILRVEIDPSTKKKSAKLPPYIPPIVQIGKLIQECLDLKAFPKKLFLRALLDHTTNDLERNLLSLLCSKVGHVYDDVILESRLGFVTLLKSLPNCKPPISVLIEHLPRLMPRPYSIGNYHDGPGLVGKLRVIFSLNDERPGLTTTMLKNCCINGDPIFLYFRKSTHFTYTEDDVPNDIVMLGVGTGIAPYLSFLEKRSKAMNSKSLGKTWLFAGFRYEQCNYLCRDELEQYMKTKMLNNLSVAFSRDQGAQFRYVQDQIEANKEALVKMLCGSECKLFVCGDGKTMLPQIERKFAEIVGSVQGIGPDESANLIADFKKNQKYVEDIWL
ncbi:methionine synthase reductase-like [Ochlerotatus camptorhynchus]|uniref:methionine synthase reductase-like n=1 Tax=Ochlerotatus camptorhynchus TaxID=644619 RepID=UPI0031DF16D7